MVLFPVCIVIAEQLYFGFPVNVCHVNICTSVFLQSCGEQEVIVSPLCLCQDCSCLRQTFNVVRTRMHLNDEHLRALQANFSDRN
jgi:hypothetical protein